MGSLGPRGYGAKAHEPGLGMTGALGMTAARLCMPHGARKSLMTRDMLMEEVDALPPEHFLRRLVAKCGYRLVGVENKVETHRARSQLLLNQAVLDVVAANDGERFDVSHLIRNGGDNRGHHTLIERLFCRYCWNVLEVWELNGTALRLS